MQQRDGKGAPDKDQLDHQKGVEDEAAVGKQDHPGDEEHREGGVAEGAEPALIAAEHGCGLRVEPEDPAALAEGILRMRKSGLEEMGRRARDAFEQSYDRPIATDAYRKLLEEVVTEATKRA